MFMYQLLCRSYFSSILPAKYKAKIRKIISMLRLTEKIIVLIEKHVRHLLLHEHKQIL